MRHSARRAREAARRRRAFDLAWRSAVLVLGVALVLGGIVLLPLPGPGWVVIFLGLGLLATEFTWAARVLHRARHHYERAARRARSARRGRARRRRPAAEAQAGEVMQVTDAGRRRDRAV